MIQLRKPLQKTSVCTKSAPGNSFVEVNSVSAAEDRRGTTLDFANQLPEPPLHANMAKAKQFVRPPKKQKAKPAAPETADDFQDAADREEETGGKHRVGDGQKSTRAFLRALDLYDQGLKRHPTNFDLAYNKARLLLEITQQPTLVEHVGVSLEQLLQQALAAHRDALRLNEELPDVLFNTSQVLIALAEQVSEVEQRAGDAITLLQEALELLSACLSRQEMLLEQQQLDFEDVEGGGVQLDPGEQPESTAGSDPSEQSAHVETPLTPNDLLETVHASLSALTTMISLVDPNSLQTFADMAHTLTEKKAPGYIDLLPPDMQATARFAIGLDRAIFIAAFVDAQFNADMIELETYIARLDAFALPERDASAHALSAEASARKELVLSLLDRDDTLTSQAATCWKQLTTAQDLLTTATKLGTDDAKERKPETYSCKGDVELLRHRVASTPTAELSDSVKRSAQTLLSNSQTYYRGAAQLAKAEGDDGLEVKAQQRWLIAGEIAGVMYDAEVTEPAFDPQRARGDVVAALEECVREGYVGEELGQAVMARLGS